MSGSICTEVLAENNRLSESAAIIDAFQVIMRSFRGEVKCVVISAKVCALPLGWCGGPFQFLTTARS